MIRWAGLACLLFLAGVADAAVAPRLARLDRYGDPLPAGAVKARVCHLETSGRE